MVVQDISVGDYLSLRTLLAALLEDHLKGPLPEAKQLKTADNGVTDAHRRWLTMLDLCAPPEILRLGVTKLGPDDKALLTLLHYLHRMGRAVDHDRFDWVITYMFKRRLESGDLLSAGDIAGVIVYMFPEFDQAPLSDRTRQQLAVLRAQQAQVESFTEFQQFAKSDVIAKGREIKESFGRERYHPAVLGAVVSYNLALGQTFQSLIDKPAVLDGGQTAGSKQPVIAPPPINIRHREIEIELSPESAEPQAGGFSAFQRDAAPSEAPAESGLVSGMTSNPKELGIDKKREADKMAEAMAKLAAFFQLPENHFETLACIDKLRIPLTDFEALAVQTNFPADDESFRAQFSRGMKQSAGLALRIAEEGESLRTAPASSFFREVHQKALIWLLASAREHVQALHKLADAAGKAKMYDKQRQVMTSAERLSATVDSVLKAS